jgi:Holliday junction resolvasome RuvABC ATP-dependent DNA helicase subunit
MAWNYRKRVKIAPGVHINFSKNGISSSIGPKGAKVTFGKRGTYMSTSIPGIGLYSRQKIGSGIGTLSTINSTNSSNNNGCLGCLKTSFSMVLIVVGLCLLMGKTPTSIILGLLFIITGGFVFFKYIFADNKNDSLEVNNLIDNQISPNKETGITQEFISEDSSIDSRSEEGENFLGVFDPLFENAAYLIIINQSASTSLIQRKFAIGYNRASIIMEQLEKAGVVGAADGYKPREVLIHNEDEWLILKNHLLSELANKDGNDDVLETSSPHQLTEDQFNLIKSASDNLCAFMTKVGRKRNVRAKLDEMMQLENSDGTPWEISKKVRLVILTDVYRCYKGLGHDFFMDDDNENIGIYLFMSKYLKPDFDISYNNISDFRLKIKDSFVDVLKTSDMVNQNAQMSPNEFFLQKALGECDGELQTQYMTLLYRFASAVAKADGQVNETEEKWLADIMKSKDLNIGNGSNVRTTTNREQETVESPYDMLKDLIGLSSVKEEITKLANFIKIQQVRESKGLRTPDISFHCVFTGNPGTGKTTVARIMASIYKDLGILKKGHLVETDRSGLVAEYVGQTAVKTNKIIDSALDGVLFIDEAYSLVQGAKEDFGQEAISTLLKRMEDDRNRLVVILAGYSSEMKGFIDSNPGLQSRFNRYIHFPDYTAEELKQIFLLNANKNQYTIDEEASSVLGEIMSSAIDHKDKNFGNARFVRNLFEKSIQNQATRLSSEQNITEEVLSMLKAEDLPVAYDY